MTTQNMLNSPEPFSVLKGGTGTAGTGLLDTNGNIGIGLTTTPSAVNYINITNSITGHAPLIGPSGSDTNIGLTFTTKGTGSFLFFGNGANSFGISTVASSVNYVTTSPATTTNPPTLAAAGTDTNVILQLLGQGTGGVQTQGTSAATPANAPAGYVGEFVSSIVTYASNTAISSATPTNITSISLTAGDWDVWGNTGFEETAVAFSAINGGISLTSATLPNKELIAYNNITVQSTVGFSVPPLRVNVGATTTVYLIGQVTFASGAARMFGGIYARRRR